MDNLICIWLKYGSIAAPTEPASAEVVESAWSLFHEIENSSPDAARSRLAKADGEGNRLLGWLLLGAALRLDMTMEAERAERLVNWAQFVAKYGDSLKNRTDRLEAHCEFYRGVLNHRAERLDQAQRAFEAAEAAYRDPPARTTLASLALLGQGLVALDVNDADGHRTRHKGAREAFRGALELVEGSGRPDLIDEVRAIVDRSLAQWEFMDELVRADAPAARLCDRPDLKDAQLVGLLKGRMRGLAVNEGPLSQAVTAARLAEQLGKELGLEVRCLDELKNYYYSSRQLDRLEAIQRERLLERPDDAEAGLELARTLLMQSRHAEVRGLLEDLEPRLPDRSELHVMLGAALYHLDKTKAISHLRRVLELDPDDASTAWMLHKVEAELRAEEPMVVVDPQSRQIIVSAQGMEGRTQGEIEAALMAATLLALPEGPEAGLELLGESSPELAERVTELLRAQGYLGGRVESEAERHHNLAKQAFARGLWDEAIGHYRRAVAAAPDFAEAYMGWGDVYYRTGQYYLAMSYFEESVAIRPLAPTYRFLGDTYVKLGKRKAAIEAYRQALALDPSYGGAKQSLAMVLAAGDDDDRDAGPAPEAGAGPAVLRPESPRGPVQDSPLEREKKLRDLFNFTTIHDSGPRTKTDELALKIDEKLPYFSKVIAAPTLEAKLEVVRRKVAPKDYERLILILGTIEFFYKEKEHRPDEALILAQLKHQLAAEVPPEWEPGVRNNLGPARLMADTLANLGNHYDDAGQPQKALDHWHQAEAWFERDAQERGLRGLSLLTDLDRAFAFAGSDVRKQLFASMARVYGELGEAEKAAEYGLKAGVAVTTRGPYTADRLNQLSKVEHLLASAGDYDGALKRLHEALDLAVSDHHSMLVSSGVTTACCDLGDLLGQLRLPHVALRYLRRALELDSRTGHLGRISRDHVAIGRVLDGREDLGDPLAHYLDAIRCVSAPAAGGAPLSWQTPEGESRRVVDPDAAWPGLLGAAGVYLRREEHDRADALLSLAIELGELIRSQVIEGEHRIALQADRMRPYDLLIRMHARLAARQRGSTEAAGHALRAFEYAERARSRAFLESLGGSEIRPPEIIPELQRVREAELIGRLRLLSEAGRGEGQLEQRTRWDEYESIRVELEVLWREMGGLGPAAADYVDLRRGQPLGFDTLRRLLDNPAASRRAVLVEYYTTDDAAFVFGVRPDSEAPDVVEVPLDATELRRFVQSNFGAQNRVREFLDMELDELWHAYGALVEPVARWAGPEEVILLVPHGLLHYLPLHALRLDGRDLIDRNPVLYSPSASVLKYCQARHRPLAGGTPEGPKVAIFGDSRNDLPYARAEAEALGRLSGAEPVLGDAVTRAAVLGAIQEADVVHFAGHGDFHAPSAMDSGLRLAGGETLTAREIFGLDNLRAQLVTLSGCETGINERRPGDELIGLTRAFLNSGTPTVLVSLWRVPDESTASLMVDFYGSLLGGVACSKVEALRRAIRNLKACAGWETFYHWAPFVLVGDWS